MSGQRSLRRKATDLAKDQVSEFFGGDRSENQLPQDCASEPVEDCMESNLSGSDNEAKEDNSEDDEEEWEEEENPSSEDDPEDEPILEDDPNSGNSCSVLLKAWALKFNISLHAVKSLLVILKSEGLNVPQDPRTLLQTPREKTVTSVLENGIYTHIGLLNGLKLRASQGFMNDSLVLKIDINVDGVSMFKSTSEEAWPILGRCKSFRNKSPFVIGVFYGLGKPSPSSDFFQEYIAEVKQLQTEGFVFNNSHFQVVINNYICDAPARSYIKNCKGHTAKDGCERCEQEGQWDGNQVVFSTKTSVVKRSDISFEQRMDPEHHGPGLPPLHELNTRHVSQFVLEPMHLIDLGITKRFLQFVVGSAPLNARMSARQVIEASDAMIHLRDHIPMEFSRKPREFKHLSKWKATEFRLHTLYVGIVALRPFVKEEVFKCFLLFHVAYTIISSEKLTEMYLGMAKNLLENFVLYSSQIFGSRFVSYNVHSVLHITDDVKAHGCIPEFSAYIFEDFLGKLAKLVRSKARPLQQIVRRLHELQSLPPSSCARITGLQREQTIPGPVPQGFDATHHFRIYGFHDFSVTLKDSDNGICLEDGMIGRVRNVVKKASDGAVYFIVQLFFSRENVYDYPMESSKLGIYKVTNMSPLYYAKKVTKVVSKCMLLPNGDDSFVSLPLLHISLL